MNKIKTTKKQMRQNFYILGVGYCDLQALLKFERPIAYSVRAEGWACDYYSINDVIISTGYSPLNSKNMKEDHKIIKQYENKASSIYEAEKLKKLLCELIERLKK